MSFVGALATFGATAAGLVGVGTGAVAGAAGAAGASAAALGATSSALIGAGTAATAGAGLGAIQAAATGQDIGKGALMGAGTGLATAGVGSGLAAGAKAAGMAGAIGNTATNVAVGATTGAAIGAGSSAVKGEDIGKGALIGGATGAVTAGAGEMAGGIGGPKEVPTTDLGLGKPAGPTTPATLADTAGTGTTTNPLPELGKIDPGTPIGTNDPTGPSVLAKGPDNSYNLGAIGRGAVAGAVTNYAGQSMLNADEAAKKAEQQNAQGAIDFANQNQAGMANLKGLGFGAPSGPLSSLSGIGKATGGLTALAHGGQIPLKDGAYIIPADVVSALGNGSSKAGAEFLRHLMMEVRKEAVNIQGLGAAKKHGA